MVTNTVLRMRKRRIEGDIIIFEARLKAATQSLEIRGLQSRLDELKMRVASIDSILNTVAKLNDSKKVKAGEEIKRDLSLVHIVQPLPPKKLRKGRKLVKLKKEDKKAKPLFQV